MPVRIVSSRLHRESSRRRGDNLRGDKRDAYPTGRGWEWKNSFSLTYISTAGGERKWLLVNRTIFCQNLLDKTRTYVLLCVYVFWFFWILWFSNLFRVSDLVFRVSWSFTPGEVVSWLFLTNNRAWVFTPWAGLFPKLRLKKQPAGGGGAWD